MHRDVTKHTKYHEVFYNIFFVNLRVFRDVVAKFLIPPVWRAVGMEVSVCSAIWIPAGAGMAAGLGSLFSASFVFRCGFLLLTFVFTAVFISMFTA